MHRFAKTCPVPAALLVVLFVGDALYGKSAATELSAQYRRLSEAHSAAFPAWRPKSPETGSLLFVATDEYSRAEKGGDKDREARNKYADSLFELAKQAADSGQSSLAFQWATEVVHEKRDGQWLTAYGAKMFDAGKVWHPKFGWVAAADIPRYEKGERQLNGRWA